MDLQAPDRLTALTDDIYIENGKDLFLSRITSIMPSHKKYFQKKIRKTYYSDRISVIKKNFFKIHLTGFLHCCLLFKILPFPFGRVCAVFYGLFFLGISWFFAFFSSKILWELSIFFSLYSMTLRRITSSFLHNEVGVSKWNQLHQS